MESTVKEPKVECAVHFPKLPPTIQGFTFIPVEIELKPKRVGP